MRDAEVDRYLHRIGEVRPASTDRDALAALQFAHMVNVPFENLDIVFAGGVPHDRDVALEKILSGRGGWCFELNGSFARLLVALGWDVRLLGAAVLLGGPARVLDHLALEVSGGDAGLGAHLVDVGFGTGFTGPLDLNSGDDQSDRAGSFRLIGSPEGTTLTLDDEGVPAAQYRFKRVSHDFDDFAAVAASLQSDAELFWSTKPFTTRLLGDGDDRVTLTRDTLKVRRDGDVDERRVGRDEWDGALDTWFSMRRPGPWPD